MSGRVLPATGLDCAALFAGIPPSCLVMSPVAPDYVILDANDAYLANVERTAPRSWGCRSSRRSLRSADTFDEHGVPWIRRSFDRAVASGRPDSMPPQNYDVPDPSGTGMTKRYGAAVGVQDSTVKALAADPVPRDRRATACGVFAAVQGGGALLGGVAAGGMYQDSVEALAAVTVVLQVLALALLVDVTRRQRDSPDSRHSPTL